MNIFVYGTLKQGFPNFHINAGTRVGGRFHTVHKLPLYLVGERHVPWLVNSPGIGFHVPGEVYEVGGEALVRVDALEQIHEADGYQRLEIDVVEAGGAPLRVQCYLKRAEQLAVATVQAGPLADYTLELSAHYRSGRLAR